MHTFKPTVTETTTRPQNRIGNKSIARKVFDLESKRKLRGTAVLRAIDLKF